MTGRALTCIRCGGPVEIVEDVEAAIEWGPATLGADGVVRPADPRRQPSVVMSDNSRIVGRPRACCMKSGCGHQWRLRRPFDVGPEV